MFMYVFSIALIVVSNTLYHICQKKTPQGVNPFTALFATYLLAAVITLTASFFYKTDKGVFQSFKELNWTSIMLGFAIVGLELGYFLAYRAGWDISVGPLVANIILALMLIPIGLLFFKEGFDIKKVLGAAFCIVGLILINK